MNKTIFVLLDACRYDQATEHAGCLEHLIDYNQGAKYLVKGELPSISRPMYATIFTGLPAYQHGILSNMSRECLTDESVFTLCQKNNKVTAAAAYWWYPLFFSEKEFDITFDRFQLNRMDFPINHGIYYQDNSYPDAHLISDGEFLRTEFHPDFLLIHTMNIDAAGHDQGGNSKFYSQMMGYTNELVGRLIPKWLADGYSVVVTGDHGINDMGIHGGNTEQQRMVPLYLFGEQFVPGRFDTKEISQLQMAPLLCKLLGITPAKTMKEPCTIQFR